MLISVPVLLTNAVCIDYDVKDNVITIDCKFASLTDVYNEVDKKNVLDKLPNGIWLLNANLVINNDTTMTIDSKDTSWLKILSSDNSAYSIRIFGNLVIDSVKITSWEKKENNYTESSRDNNVPRPYIRIESNATGTTNITNSEISHLGYEGDRRSGINFYGGDGSKLSGNDIHHLARGFYSKGVGNMIIENNHFHHNYRYGIDPHNKTHDMIIRNNLVYNNGGQGIICSLNCYNITVQGNTVHNNEDAGIMFSRNVFDSLVWNNTIYNEIQGIFISKSHDNEIYNNTIFNSKNGVNLKAGSYSNVIGNNNIENVKKGIIDNTETNKNRFYSNTIINATNTQVDIL